MAPQRVIRVLAAISFAAAGPENDPGAAVRGLSVCKLDGNWMEGGKLTASARLAVCGAAGVDCAVALAA